MTAGFSNVQPAGNKNESKHGGVGAMKGHGAWPAEEATQGSSDRGERRSLKQFCREESRADEWGCIGIKGGIIFYC